MGKKFVGLDGLKHFWTKAKTWIAGQITAEVTAKIAELVANAPEDLDTLKEIADWISAHADDASAMNTAILANTEAISGKADKSHTHTKSEITDFPTSLPANGGTADKARYGFFGMLGGADQAVSSNFTDLLNNELGSNQTGGLRGGSINVSVGQEAKNLGIPVNMWYNFLYIPHRTGIGMDNHYYGSLIVIPMTNNDGTFYIIHRVNGYNYLAHRFDSVT